MRLSINNFFKGKLFKRFFLYMGCGVFIIFVTLLGFSYQSSIKSEREKIVHLIDSNKEDIFNALILDEYESVEKNIEILGQNYNFDRIQINYKGKILRTNKELNGADFLLRNLYATEMTQTVKNDFGTVSFDITFSYYRKVYYEGLLPSMKVFFVLTLFLGLALWIFYRKHRQLIESSIVSPLLRIVESIEKEEYEINVNEFDRIHEFSVLAKSIKQFKDIRYAQMHTEIANQFAHDIRTPLNAIRRIIDQDPYFRTEKMDYLKISLDRIESVSHDLLSFRKNSKRTEVTEVNSSVLIDKIYNEFRIANGIQVDFLKFKKGHNFVFSAYIEINIFERIISNILANSWEAVKERTIPKVTVSIGMKDKNVEIVFLDNGEGISDSIIQNIFDTGFTTKESGNGLGLSSAKKYLISIGGDVTVESEQDIFTRITLILPVVSVLKEKNNQTEKRVILIDDDRYNHIPIISYCKESDIHFSGYSNIEDFFSEAEVINDQSVVLLDSHLGSGQRGEDFANRITQLGFKDLYLYTASTEINLLDEEKIHLKGIIEKSDIKQIDRVVNLAYETM